MFEVFMIGLTGAGVIAWALVCYVHIFELDLWRD